MIFVTVVAQRTNPRGVSLLRLRNPKMRRKRRILKLGVESHRIFRNFFFVPIFKEETPSSRKKNEVRHAADDAAFKEAEKILRKYSVTLGRLAE